MKGTRHLRVICLVIFLTIFIVKSNLTWGQSDYPSKPITIIITHNPGGSTDKPIRLIAPFIEKYLKATLVLTNMPGAGGAVARAHAYKQPPSGYVLLFSQSPSLSISALISENAGFDPLKFVPIYNVSGGNYQGIAVRYDSPYKNLKEILEANKTKPMTMAGSGIGAISHLNALQLNKMMKANITYVPFNASTEGMMACAGGTVDMVNTNYTMIDPMEKAKKLKLITVLGPKRGQYSPDVPTAKELGIPVEMDQLGGLFGPPGLPDEIVKKLATAVEKAAKDPEFLAIAKKANEDLDPMGPEEFKKAIKKIHEICVEIVPELKKQKK